MVSRCCTADVDCVYTEMTNYYVCTKCKRPCDLKERLELIISRPSSDMKSHFLPVAMRKRKTGLTITV